LKFQGSLAEKVDRSTMVLPDTEKSVPILAEKQTLARHLNFKDSIEILMKFLLA
jgi:hypothetical protein